jgi:enoyl-CoA hydratase
MFQYVELVKQEEKKLATIWINRKDSFNALNSNTLREINEALALCERDRSIRAIVIRGKGGKAFISGSDIEEMSNMSPIEFREYSQIFTGVCNAMKFLSKPVIAAVEGVCFGGGNLIAAHCDFVIATEKSKFGQLEINVGIFGGVSRMISLVGERRAMEICLLGKIVNADEAERIGLITKRVPSENFETE